MQNLESKQNKKNDKKVYPIEKKKIKILTINKQSECNILNNNNNNTYLLHC